MDLALYARVLRRHWLALVVGSLLAVMLSIFSYYRVDFGSVPPKFTPRKAEVWQSTASVLLTQKSQVIPVPGVSDPGRLAAVANLYARLATSDEVLRRANVAGNALQATAPIGRTTEATLPVVTLLGSGVSAEGARAVVSRGLASFLAFVQGQQGADRVPKGARVQLRVLNSPQPAVLIVGRKKTLPIVVFLAVLIATIAAVFVLENWRLRSPVAEVELRTATHELGTTPGHEDETESEVPAASVRRWA